MALAKRDLQALVGRSENDNQISAAYAVSPRHQAPPLDPFRLDLPNLTTGLDDEAPILWAWMRHPERACFTPGLMADGLRFQAGMRQTLAGVGAARMPFRWLVWGSRAAGAWSMGGDLATFTRLIRTGDEAGLRRYAHDSVEVLFDNHRGMGLPVLTAALVEGDAVGGGFEAMLTNDLVVAETGSKFGLPEIHFNLFPGMGAYSLLQRRLGEAAARRLIEGGCTHTAEEMHQLGLVDIVCAKGHGPATLRRAVAERSDRFLTDLALKRVRQRVNPLTRAELIDVVELWVELAMALDPTALRRMDALGRHQERRRASA